MRNISLALKKRFIKSVTQVKKNNLPIAIEVCNNHLYIFDIHARWAFHSITFQERATIARELLQADSITATIIINVCKANAAISLLKNFTISLKCRHQTNLKVARVVRSV